MMRHVFFGAVLTALGLCPALAQSPVAPAEIRPQEYVRREAIIGAMGAQVLSMDEALRQWDGRRELLLVPEERPSSHARARVVATIGAAFSADGADVEASRDCYREVAEAQFSEGALRATTFIGPPMPKPVSFYSHPLPDTSDDHIIESGRCRYRIHMTRKVMRDGAWQPVVAAMGVASDGTRRAVSDLDFEERMKHVDARFEARSSPHVGAGSPAPSAPRPNPAELGIGTLSFGFGGVHDQTAAQACPTHSGTLVFNEDGLRIALPWFAGDPITPGLVRDPEARTTTLIVQNTACRLELQVSREVNLDGQWHRSALASFPAPRAL